MERVMPETDYVLFTDMVFSELEKTMLSFQKLFMSDTTQQLLKRNGSIAPKLYVLRYDDHKIPLGRLIQYKVFTENDLDDYIVTKGVWMVFELFKNMRSFPFVILTLNDGRSSIFLPVYTDEKDKTTKVQKQHLSELANYTFEFSVEGIIFGIDFAALAEELKKANIA